MAKKFAKLDYEIYKEEEKEGKGEDDVVDVPVKNKEAAKATTTTTKPTFVSTLINVIDETMDISHALQGMVIVFVINLLYLMFQQERISTDSLVTIGCTFVTCIIELIAVIRNRFLKKPGEEISLPEWEYVYSIVFPLIIASLFSEDEGATISCMVVQVGYMNVWVRLLVSYVVALQFGVALMVPVIMAICYESVSYLLPQVSISERSAISMIIAVMIHYIPVNVELIVLRGLVISTICAFIGSTLVYKVYVQQEDRSVRFALLFALYAVFICTFLVSSDKILYPVLQESPLLWVKNYIKAPIMWYWLILTGCVPILFTILSRPSLPIALRRKAWHILLFAALAKPLVDEPGLTALALGAVLALLIIVESIRATGLPPIGGSLQRSLALFADRKDANASTMVSPAYLVLGVAAPLWLNLALGQPERLSSYSGVLTVGLGDAAASIIGSQYGRNLLPGSRNGKTVEGTFAMAVAVAAGAVYIQEMMVTTTTAVAGLSLANTTVFAVVAALFEGLLEGNDNLWVPALAYILAELLHKF